MHCIILAGGFATRLWPLTENKAKPLLYLKDRPILSHLVEAIPKDIPITVSTNAVFRDDFLAWRNHFPDREIEIFIEDSVSNEGKKGALGATALVIEQKGLQEDLLLLAGDNYFGFKVPEFLAAFKGNPLLAAHDVREVNEARRFGVVVTEGGRVVEFQEKPMEPKSTLVSTGCYIFPAKNLKDIVDYSIQKKDDLGGIFEYFMKKGERVNAFAFAEPWYDIGAFEAYLKAHHELMQGENIVAPEASVQGSEFKGGVYVAPGAVVEQSVLENVIVLSGSVLKNCVIRNVIIDENCHLKNLDLSHQMVRRGSRIEW